MAKAKAPAAPGPDAVPEHPKSKLRKLIVSNFGCIGTKPVEIDLDSIVVLVGPNNAGKSTILRAYQLIMGSSAPVLTIDDFFERRIDDKNLPTIELHTAVADELPASHWIDQVGGEKIVREQWTWSLPGAKAKRVGWDVTIKGWSPNSMPWGAANVSNSRRPIPHRIEAFADPIEQIQEVTQLLLDALAAKFKDRKRFVLDEHGKQVLDEHQKPKLTEFGVLLDSLARTQKSVVAEAKTEIDQVEQQLTKFVGGVFAGYEVTFDAKAEDDLTKALSFFKAGATLRMGPKNGHSADPTRQGSGARRTLMWAALHFLAESEKDENDDRAHLLLLDEPELCLHPDAIREACATLYDLTQAGHWQVMITTHAPTFIDLSRDNTTVVRVERQMDQSVIGTTVFRPLTAKLSEDEKTELKLLNYYDSHFAEFFFGGKTILVEGDTEFTAFRWVIAQDPQGFKNVHVVRSRGKATTVLLAKILNVFSAPYAVLHDSDSPTIERKDGTIVKNGAWTSNSSILSEVTAAIGAKRTRLVAAVPGFELALFGKGVDDEKPYNAYTTLKEDAAAAAKVTQLLRALVKFDGPLPEGCLEWSKIEDLEGAFKKAAGS